MPAGILYSSKRNFTTYFGQFKCRQELPAIMSFVMRCTILVPFVQFKKREKHTWRSVNFNGCFSLLLNCTNGIKWRNASHLGNSKSYYLLSTIPHGYCLPRTFLPRTSITVLLPTTEYGTAACMKWKSQHHNYWNYKSDFTRN